MEYRDVVKRKISKEIFNIIVVCAVPVLTIVYTISDLRLAEHNHTVNETMSCMLETQSAKQSDANALIYQECTIQDHQPVTKVSESISMMDC